MAGLEARKEELELEVSQLEVEGTDLSLQLMAADAGKMTAMPDIVG